MSNPANLTPQRKFENESAQVEEKSNNYAVDNYIKQMHTTQIKLLYNMQLPNSEIMNFDGNPLQYYLFIKSFEAALHLQSIDNNSRHVLLMQFCTGKAKKAIQACITMPAEESYRTARKILEQRFSYSYVIANAWI